MTSSKIVRLAVAGFSATDVQPRKPIDLFLLYHFSCRKTTKAKRCHSQDLRRGFFPFLDHEVRYINVNYLYHHDVHVPSQHETKDDCCPSVQYNGKSERFLTINCSRVVFTPVVVGFDIVCRHINFTNTPRRYQGDFKEKTTIQSISEWKSTCFFSCHRSV